MVDNLESVKFSEDPIDVPDASEVPEQVPEHQAPLPVGQGYLLQFPDKITLEESAGADGVKWLTAYFGDFGKGEPMTVVGLPEGVDKDEFGYRPFKWSISNRPWKKVGDKKVADMFYLLRAKNLLPKTANNKNYAEAMLKLAGKTIGGTVEYSASCNKKKFYAYDENNKVIEVPGQVGCGKRMYHGAISKLMVPDEKGWMPYRIKCAVCESVMWVNRAFTNFIKD